MPTFLTIVSSIMPGARSVRAPAISGLLWSLFFWLLLWDTFPADSSAERFFEQMSSLTDYIGVTATLLIASTLIFVIGAASTFAVNTLSGWAGAIQRRAAESVAWQRHAHRVRKTLEVRKRALERDANLISANETASLKESVVKYLTGRKSTNASNLSQVTRQLEKFEPLGKHKLLERLWIPRTILTESAVGQLPGSSDIDVASRIVKHSFAKAAEAHAEKLDYQEWDADEWPPAESENALLQEFEPDPLDALKALDNDLFAQLDRERSERDLRLAIAAPLIALSVLGVDRLSGWFLIATTISVGLFLANSVSARGERARVLNLLHLRGIETPAMRQAEVLARARVLQDKRDHAERAIREEAREQLVSAIAKTDPNVSTHSGSSSPTTSGDTAPTQS
ncbi:hypothetical protein [Nocardioides halotolerans]|uniref:hypothetical protein n=1 Tax=Nocardioides halotolerans TaxID=433660 RepID=UPI0012FA9595|nr:hypothetical protein [Nocardioides halotolerans]